MRRSLYSAFFLLFFFAPSLHAATNSLHEIAAGRIDANNYQQYTVGGASSIGGIGDWFISNGTLCAVFSAVEHETYLSHRGGALVDLGFCGRADDQWKSYHEMFNLSQDKIIPSDNISIELGENSASIIVQGTMSGVDNKTIYSLNLLNPEQLFITTTLTRVEKSDSLNLFGAIILHPSRSLTPFVLATDNTQFSKGFKHPFVNTNDKVGMLKVMFPADLHILIGADHIKPEISYGVLAKTAELVRNNGDRQMLKQFAINNQNFTLLGNFTNPLWFNTDGKPGLLQFAQTPLMDIDVGESLFFEKIIYVSPVADAASITNRIYKGETINGTFTHLQQRLSIRNEKGHPITFAKPDSDGTYSITLPQDIIQADKVFTPPSTSLLFKTATLTLPQGRPMRLVFKGRQVGDTYTPDPKFFRDTTAFTVDDTSYPTNMESNSLSLAGVSQDIKQIEIPQGSYTVYATRGIEYSLTRTELTIEAGRTYNLTIEDPVLAVQTPHWINADFHLHSLNSFDSTLPTQQRVIDFYAQGGEVMVPSEHKQSVNFQPTIDRLQLSNRLIQIPGVELTGMAHTTKVPRTIGHSNVFPVSGHLKEFMGGTKPHENRRLGEVIAQYKSRSPEPVTQRVFQLNHPRNDKEEIDDIYFLDHLSIEKNYDPSLPVNSSQNSSLIESVADGDYRDIDFDAIEILNGSDMDTYRSVRKDWFSFLSQGYLKTATANSDSHNTHELAAIPRNYVYMRNDFIQNFDQQEFVSSVLQGKLFGSTGPIIDVTLNQTAIGETFSGHRATLRIGIQAAQWIPVEQLAIFVNGVSVEQLAVERDKNYEVPLEFSSDSYLTVEVSGPADEVYQAVNPGFTPFAYSNPIYIDYNKDGRWDAPGL